MEKQPQTNNSLYPLIQRSHAVQRFGERLQTTSNAWFLTSNHSPGRNCICSLKSQLMDSGVVTMITSIGREIGCFNARIALKFWQALRQQRALQGFTTQGLTTKFRKVSKSRDRVLNWSYCSRCCRGACQISERIQKLKPETRGFDTSRDLAVRRPPA